MIRRIRQQCADPLEIAPEDLADQLRDATGLIDYEGVG